MTNDQHNTYPRGRYAPDTYAVPDPMANIRPLPTDADIQADAEAMTEALAWLNVALPSRAVDILSQRLTVIATKFGQ